MATTDSQTLLAEQAAQGSDRPPASEGRSAPDATLARAARKVGWFWALFAVTLFSTVVLLCIGVSAHQVHPPSSPGEAVVQMSIVVMLCVMWFIGLGAARSAGQAMKGLAPGAQLPLLQRCTAKLAALPWLLYLVMGAPAFVFAMAMRENYNPAVFAMALAAIFVAAEHFSSIGEAKEDLDETREQLDITGHKLAIKLDTHQQSIDILLSIEGLANWRKHVYSAYQRADTRVDAVIRVFDIDEIWWRLDGDWQAYRAQLLDVDKGPTLFSALARRPPKTENVARTDKVHFVGDMSYKAGVGSKAITFGNLLGLMWWLVVVKMAMQQRRASSKGKASANDHFIVVRIASSASWMHAIDDEIYQVIERPQPQPASARLLSEALAEEPARQRLSQWAHDDIKRTGRRGCDGTEYVCAVLRDAALRQDKLEEKNELTEGRIVEILHVLGWKEWHEEELKQSRERKQSACIALVQTFIRQCTGKEEAGIRDLLLELI